LVTSVAVSPDVSRIVKGQNVFSARVWDAKTFAELAVLRGHTNPIWSVAVSPDGARIVTGSHDTTARVWDAKSFAELAVLRGHTGTVNSVAVSPDEARIVTGSYDNTARVWEVFPIGQALVEQAKTLAPRCLTAEQRQRYHLAPTPPRWCANMQKWPYDAGTTVNNAVAKAIASAQEQERAGRPREAIAVLERAMAEDTEVRARLLTQLTGAYNQIAWEAFLGVALQSKPAENLKVALADADKAVALAPENGNILDTRGQIYLALGRTEEAIADLGKVIALGLNGIGTYYGRGRAQELKGNRDAAIADYRKAVSLDAENDGWEKHAQVEARARLQALGAPMDADGQSRN
jgi:tetratricopeptide (TPR) repeat protein